MINQVRQSQPQQKIHQGWESTGQSCIAKKDVAVRVWSCQGRQVWAEGLIAVEQSDRWMIVLQSEQRCAWAGGTRAGRDTQVRGMCV